MALRAGDATRCTRGRNRGSVRGVQTAMIPLAFVTLISLLVAIVMTAFAYRMAVEERRRSSARVATLAADIHDADLDLRADDIDTSGNASADLFAIAQP